MSPCFSLGYIPKYGLLDNIVILNLGGTSLWFSIVAVPTSTSVVVYIQHSSFLGILTNHAIFCCLDGGHATFDLHFHDGWWC